MSPMHARPRGLARLTPVGEFLVGVLLVGALVLAAFVITAALIAR